MQNSQRLTEAQWRKSSYSSGTGGECVECAPLGTATWRKSTHTGGACVEVADLTPHLAVRDSKAKDGPALVFPATAWSAFVESVKH
ncbi:DUF397 domain-containing protein [Streptomyces sp. NPDC058739]|uniref:DUF397 domain-containing protein n=1 Tax=Streptomyces sp. NPDC058739 TaxID=3346618 RepID=UPI0036C7F5B3